MSEMEKKSVTLKNADLLSAYKRRAPQLKVSWATYQGAQKRRGLPTVQYQSR